MFKDTKVLVHVLVCLFGISSWIDINGLWVELPLMVTRLPEAWNLPSYMTVITQTANIGPLLFTLITCVLKGRKLESPVSLLIILIGCVTCVLLGFFWHQTTVIGGDLHSTALLTLNFILALVDCTSSIAFLAFMAALKPQYMPSFFIGEGLSGMVPSLTALAQGAGQITCVNVSSTNSTQVNTTWYNHTTFNVYPNYNEPRFSVQVFFFILASLMFCSLVAFLLLKFSSYCQSEKVEMDITVDGQDNIHQNYGTNNADKKYRISTEDKGFSTGIKVILLCVVSWINFNVSSFLLSIQTYSTLPYGLNPYHLTVTLTNIANPVACFTAMFIPLLSVPGIVAFTFFGSVCCAYIITGAAYSPQSPLVDSNSGGPLMVSVTVWVLCFYLLTYAKVGVASVLRQGGRNALILCGIFTQIGSFLGAIVGFVLNNVYHVFDDAPYC
ncbi:hypothetical protein LOTGIDRAFT_111131 [Lottia gigantea]|uniref:Riboflavin transporter n=1 Tax=Lottia gigantea TaxID=225164 RepID=V4CKI0_LOTGI|nr:hypothetical protein LOTGIDRAFT_111131 [Lottia gigantea]ESP02755.1 hypothetical protein LOTGIDRAFT_111131 [Lottia gigantea]